MTESNKKAPPSRWTRPIGVLFLGWHLLGLAGLCLVLALGRAQPIDMKGLLPAMTLGLAVGATYLAGGLHPLFRLVPSVLWLALVGLRVVVSAAAKMRLSGEAPALRVVVLLYAVFIVGILAYHIYLDVGILRHRPQGPPESTEQ